MREDNEEKAKARKDRLDPVHPTPRDTSDGHVTAHHGTERRACEGSEREDGKGLASRVSIPYIGNDSSSNLPLANLANQESEWYVPTVC